MKYFTFRIPVKKYIYRYLTTLHGETIKAEMDTDLGYVVLNTLASRLDAKVCRGYNNQFKDRYKEAITFCIPYHYFYLTKKEISVHTCILLNRYFENLFEKDLYNFISMYNIEAYGRYKVALESFCALYNIEVEEDISFDSLKKKADRYRKRIPEKFLRSLSQFNGLFQSTLS